MHRQTPKAPSFGILTQLRPGRNRPRPQSRGVSTQPGPKAEVPGYTGNAERAVVRIFLPAQGYVTISARADNTHQRRLVCIGIEPETAVTDAARRFDRRLLDDDKSGAR